MARNILILGHNVLYRRRVVVFGACQVRKLLPSRCPGLLWLVDGAGRCLLLGALCARFRDIPPIVGSVMQIAFYVSAVMWKPEIFHGHQRLLVMIRSTRSCRSSVARCSGQIPTRRAYISALGSPPCCTFAWLDLFVRVRHRIAFWM